MVNLKLEVMTTLSKIRIVGLIPIFALLISCGGSDPDHSSSTVKEQSENVENSDDPMKNKGIGPVKNVKLGPIDALMAQEGQKIYQAKCSACHKSEEKFIGPAPKGILDRRSPEWVMNMILNPEEMIQKDPVARQLLIDYNLAPMANQHLSQDEARKILEYFRTL